ncbi:GFA family protein [Sedimentitalea arenosa]|uniref:GFA family protein n=1 Tax=Sedimentitalea arenosa TaxID=2798803 RepID=UPI001E356C64|nr:GFA family protein [Arenibacterium arenosum]
MDEAMAQLKGQCLCGAVGFSARAAATEFAACHCKMCQRWAGSALLAVTVGDADITWRGAEHIRRIASSDWAERAWCDACGTGLWYRITDGPLVGSYEVPIGLFDDSAGITLTREIFVDHKSPSFAFAGDLDQMTEAQTLAMFGVTPEGA